MRNRTAKGLLLLLLLFLIALSAGCFALSVRVGVDEAHTAYLEYVIDIDYADMPSQTTLESVRDSMAALRSRYAELGFQVSEEALEGRVKRSVLRYEESAVSDEEAFEKLRALLENDTISPFSELEAVDFHDGTELAFSMEGVLDVSQSASATHMDALPPDLQPLLREGLEKLRANLSITLPAISVPDDSEQVVWDEATGLATFSKEISFRLPTAFKLQTLVHSDEMRSLVHMQQDSALLREQAGLYAILIKTALVAALLLCLLMLLVFTVKKKRPAPKVAPEDMKEDMKIDN